METIEALYFSAGERRRINRHEFFRSGWTPDSAWGHGFPDRMDTDIESAVGLAKRDFRRCRRIRAGRTEIPRVSGAFRKGNDLLTLRDQDREVFNAFYGLCFFLPADFFQNTCAPNGEHHDARAGRFPLMDGFLHPKRVRKDELF